MPDLTKALFLQALDAWGRYGEAFSALPRDKQAAFLKEQGFASLPDLLVHVAAWWEEAVGIIGDALARRQRPPRKYDMDAFNAAALARFKDAPETEMFAWYEARRHEMIALVSALTDRQMKVRRVSGWLDAVILGHLKEHCLDAARFLTADMLQREWAGCVARFQALPAEQQSAFLLRQGFPRFRDLAAHILAWWEEGIRVIQTASDDAVRDAQDVDTFNADALAKYGKLTESEVFAAFETTRRTLINLADTLPDEVFHKANVQDWLRSDVMRHYFEHAG
jgi:hypothetical protein